LYWSKQVNA
jgi:hypothetical protein